MGYLIAFLAGVFVGMIALAEAVNPKPLSPTERLDREQDKRNARFARFRNECTRRRLNP